jgi:hypothetical protein
MVFLVEMESDLAPPANPASPQENTGEISWTQRATELISPLIGPIGWRK